MSSSGEFNEIIKSKRILCDEEVKANTKGNLVGVWEDEAIDLGEKHKDKFEGIIESTKALSSRLVSSCYSLEPEIELGDASGAWLTGFISPAPHDFVGDTDSGAINSWLAQDTLALALLYQTSRRSRHSPHDVSGDSVTIPPKTVPSPLLIPSAFLGQQICHDANTGAREGAWSFNIAPPIVESCSSSSVSSTTFKELTTHEAVTANELWGEDNPPKRRKMTPEK